MGRVAEGVNIVLRNPQTGAVEVFSSGSDLPDWAAEAVTNQDALAPGERYDRGGELPAGLTTVLNDSGEPESVASDPPRVGRGSGRGAWAAHADKLGVAYAEDDTRDDIIAAVDAEAEDDSSAGQQ